MSIRTHPWADKRVLLGSYVHAINNQSLFVESQEIFMNIYYDFLKWHRVTSIHNLEGKTCLVEAVEEVCEIKTHIP
jgi:hypothetical protein